MLRIHAKGLLIGGGFILAACAARPSAADKSEAPKGAFASVTPEAYSSERVAPGRQFARLAFSSRVGGEVAECGCAVNPRGGIDRRYNFIRNEQLGLKPPAQLAVFDAGNALFTSDVADPTLRADLEDRARWMLKAHAKMGVRAQNVGFMDLTLGVSFLKAEAAKAGLALLSSNLVDAQGRAVFPTRASVDLGGGFKASVIGLTAGSPRLPDGLRAEAPLATAKTLINATPANELIIVLSDIGRAAEEELAEQTERPLLIVGARDHDGLEYPLHVHASIILQPQIQGQQWSVVDLWWKDGATGWSNEAGAQRAASQWPLLASGSEDSARLRAYEPVGLNTKIIYEHRLGDMTAALNGKNEFSAIVKKYSPRR